MRRDWKLWALGAAIGAQLLVLAGELLGAAYPLWFGQEVRLQVQPVDPRSLFRGNYARLDYEIGRVKWCKEGLRKGEVVYVHLQADTDGIMRAQGLSLERPDEGAFIRGRVTRVEQDCREVHVRYGVEAYFLPRDKALVLEDELRREEAVATVMIAANGKAALIAVEAGPSAE